MPNLCDNTLKIHGEKESLERIMEEITILNDEGKRNLDFNKIVPQPYNIFTFSVNNEIIQAINKYIELNNITDKNEISRIINDDAWSDSQEDDKKFSFIDMTKREFVTNYGDTTYPANKVVESWYVWNNENWGTKWNALSPNEVGIEGNTLFCSFMTAWAPPIPVYETLINKYEDNEDYIDIDIEYSYYEPGVGFVGDRYEEVDSKYINGYAKKILEHEFEELVEYIGITFDKKLGRYREMNEEETAYFEEHDTMEGFGDDMSEEITPEGRKFIIVTSDFANDLIDTSFLGIGFSSNNNAEEAYKDWIWSNHGTATNLVGHNITVLDLSESVRFETQITEEHLEDDYCKTLENRR